MAVIGWLAIGVWVGAVFCLMKRRASGKRSLLDLALGAGGALCSAQIYVAVTSSGSLTIYAVSGGSVIASLGGSAVLLGLVEYMQRLKE